MIRAKLPFDATTATAAQLSDPSYAAGPEIGALNSLHPRVKQCQQEALAALTPVAPAIVPVLSESYTAADGYVASLKGEKISWGAFNTLRKERAAALKDEITTILGQNASQ